ncbi:Putative nuclease [Cavenderia fasciculata]|uniref:Ribosomal RNA-processing protein 40 n=1 Tax=Cavenderia fasciculata TaxID=261658 RepID=F4QCE1_CACFS|nr:Putative nuclease [Cavenderia fasciculata]EGG13576.1 Putative nuclease [Cavenderia fasciculata]|eukprot:XP_004350280.1 Putative nuclease [Cavenderia fasciculata]
MYVLDNNNNARRSSGGSGRSSTIIMLRINRCDQQQKREVERKKEIVAADSVGVGDMNTKIDQFVVPGDAIGQIDDLKVRIGPGLLQNKDQVVASKAGVLRFSKFHKFYWIENEQKRYVPQAEDMVIGIILEKHPESFKVDIGSSSPAMLSAYSFEGATKSNKPLLSIGNLVYCRVLVANKDMEPELVCVSIRNKAEGFGQLIGGYMFNCSLGLSHYLLSEDCSILKIVGTHIPYEIAVGVNGRVWVNSASNQNTIITTNTILNSQYMPDDQIESFIIKSLAASQPV